MINNLKAEFKCFYIVCFSDSIAVNSEGINRVELMGIKIILLSALENDERAIARLWDYFHSIATAYLRTKARRNNFLLQHMYRDIDDLALDCIADLFGREDNSLSQIIEYFDIAEIQEMKESEVAIKIRRLVFSKVNEGLYRNYQKLDPSLSKIIRNLKRTLEEQKVEGASYNSKLGMIELGASERQLPVMPDEILEAKLAYGLSSLKNTVDTIVHLKFIMSEENDYAPKVPLTGFAIMLRKVFAQQLKMEDDRNERKPYVYNDQELVSFIEKSISRQRIYLHKTYVKSDKVEKEQFQKYLSVASDILESEYINDKGRGGYFEHFLFHFPEVAYENYRSHHRQVLEYVVKKIRGQMVLEIKKEENFSRFNYR